MAADRVSFGYNPANDLGVLFGLTPDHEERRGHRFLLQDVEQSWRIFRVRSVVERKANLARGFRTTRQKHSARQRGRQRMPGELSKHGDRTSQHFTHHRNQLRLQTSASKSREATLPCLPS